MELQNINNSNLKTFLNKEEIVTATAQQIMKDFGMFGVEIIFSGKIESAYDELHSQLVIQIKILMDRDMEKLMSVLYQVDISDAEIRKAEKELPGYTNVEVIAHQIIVRDLKKVLTRNYFKNKE